MEALKLAFETVIVGLFALPALWIMIDLVNPGLFSSPAVRRLIQMVPSELRPAAIGVALFSVVYLLGSMITPVACEFLNDPDMLGKYLPTENKIQVWAYTQMDSPPRIAGLMVPEDVPLVNFKSLDSNTQQAKAAERFRNSVHAEFQRDESTLLLKGPEACDRLNRLHEQLTVLRGAAFSAFGLSALCLLAWCGKSGKLQLLRRIGGLAATVSILLVSAEELLDDVHHPEAGDIPIAELVFLVLGGFGLFVLIWGTRSRLQAHGPMFVVALCFAVLCYAGYGSIATSYDQAVYTTYQALGPAAIGGSSPAGRSEMAANLGEER